jgi:putative molybdopterin biosynthesis protein
MLNINLTRKSKMDPVQKIDNIEVLGVLGDHLRLAILRLLMSSPATLSQLGRALGMHPAKVRYHVKRLENAGLVELVSERTLRGFIEKYYRATAKAYLVNISVVPDDPQKDVLIAMGSHDLALDLLAQNLHLAGSSLDMFTIPVGSLDGLIALRQGICQLACSHLWDPPTEDFNVPFVRHLFPGQSMVLFTLVNRQQGLLVHQGNPKRIRSLEDLTRQEITFVNRRLGSGTRSWLDQQLTEKGIPADEIKGYEFEVDTHLQVAQSVVERRADVGLGIMAAARKYELDFIPLFEERYDLIVTQENFLNPTYESIFEALQTTEYRNAVRDLGGYDTTNMGKVFEVD